MDTVIQFTPAQLLVYAGAIITISTAIGVIINLINKAREPEKKQDERIKACEDRVDTIGERGRVIALLLLWGTYGQCNNFHTERTRSIYRHYRRRVCRNSNDSRCYMQGSNAIESTRGRAEQPH